MISKIIATRWGREVGRPVAAALVLLSLVLTLAALAGCSPQGVVQSATASASASAANAQPTPAANPSPSVAVTSTLPVTSTQTVPSIAATASITATGVVTPGETAGVRPTPTGTPPEPLSLLNIFQFYSAPYSLVSRDVVNLDASGPDEVLFTVAGVRRTITQEVQSGVSVLAYDPVYREWNSLWSSQPISGTASPLPSTNRKEAGGYNGGNILGNTGPVMAARTTTLDGKAHLYLWRWNADKKVGEPLKMQASPGAAETDAIFTADLDANLTDINNDGVYEVALDNLKSVQIWRWDGARFVPGGER